MRRSILFLLTYILKGSQPLMIARGLRDFGCDVSVAFYVDEPGQYTQDSMDDFRAAGTLLDLSAIPRNNLRSAVAEYIDQHNVGLVVQVGCEPLYPILPYIREQRAKLSIFDLLYNDVGHVESHFAFENVLDCVIVENEYMARFISERSTKIFAPIQLIESGVDLDSFSPSARPTNHAAKLTLGYIGRMSAEKNPFGFVALAEALNQMVPNVVFKMFGEGPLSDRVKEKVSLSHLGDNLQFLGYISDVRDALSQIDVLVVPSFVDGRPMIIMEANACAIPVIANPVGGIPELIVEARNGFLCSPMNVDRISTLVKGWFLDNELLKRDKTSARSTAEMLFSRRRMLEDWRNFVTPYLE